MADTQLMNELKSFNASRDERVMALAKAVGQLLFDMGTDGLCVSKMAKAEARIAYEPFRFLFADDGDGLMPLDVAKKIVEECN